MGKTDQWMPFYIAEFIADTGDLTDKEWKGYALLLFHEWRRGPLPDDPEAVARIMHFAGPDASSMSANMLRKFFHLGEDGLWRQDRLEREKTKHLKLSATYRERAIKAAKTRWAKRHASSMSANALHARQSLSTKSKNKYNPLTTFGGSAPNTKNPPPGAKNEIAQKGTASESEKAAVWGSPTESPNVPPESNATAYIGIPEKAQTHTNGKIHKTGDLAKEKRKEKSDPRTEVFKHEVQEFWKGQNSDGSLCPWGGAESLALKDLLRTSPDLKLDRFKHLLEHRAQSQVNPSEMPRSWLRKLPAFAAGPLNQYGDLLEDATSIRRRRQ